MTSEFRSSELRLDTRDADIGSSKIQVIRQALDALGHLVMRDLQIELSQNVVMLWGRLPTYHLKQMAQVAVQQIPGVDGVVNGIEVARRSRTVQTQPEVEGVQHEHA